MNIGTLNLDINVLQCNSCKTISLADTSFYLETPSFPKIQIELPGSHLKYTFDFTPSAINVFNSFSLGYSSSAETEHLIDLPDGLYTLVYMICPYDQLFHTTYYIRQCKAWCRWERNLQHFFDSCLDLSASAERLLNRIEYLLKGAEAFAKDCDPERAIELHQKAIDLLDQLECTTLKNPILKHVPSSRHFPFRHSIR